jgi:hypothetical protein
MNVTRKYYCLFISVLYFLGVIMSCPLFEPPESLSIPPLEAEIEVSKGGMGIVSGGSYDLGNICINTSFAVIFTIGNMGSEILNLTGNPDKVVKSGPGASLFTITSQPDSLLYPGESTQFSVLFSAEDSGEKMIILSIDNDDPDENPFTFETTATGIVPPAKIPATGQTTSYAAGDDGNLLNGVSWPSPRFKVNADDVTVTDNLTGLMWKKDANTGNRSWGSAVTYANNLTLGSYTDWRLPNKNELRSLINYGSGYCAAWLGWRGFVNMQVGYYWSSTTYAPYTNSAWVVGMELGRVVYDGKNSSYYVLAVRGGQ